MINIYWLWQILEPWYQQCIPFFKTRLLCLALIEFVRLCGITSSINLWHCERNSVLNYSIIFAMLFVTLPLALIVALLIMQFIPFHVVLTRHIWNDDIRYPKLDDQTIFWKYIRSSDVKDPPRHPLTKCEHISGSEGLSGKELVSCPLDECLFTSGTLMGGVEWGWMQEESE